MANGDIQKYADMVNMQVASEAFLNKQTAPDNIVAALEDGNFNKSKEPESVAVLFQTGNPAGGPRYKLIAHQDLTLNANHTISDVNDKSGFSA